VILTFLREEMPTILSFVLVEHLQKRRFTQVPLMRTESCERTLPA
jgi:hypothetical protein